MNNKLMSSVQQQLSTIRDYVRFGVTQLQAQGVSYGQGYDNAWDEAVALVLHAIHLPHDVNPQVMDATLTSDERAQILELLQKRVVERVPVAYLTNEAWFAGLHFYVDERVMIPRSPIAELIEKRFHPWVEADKVERILDLCTGSGCIAIACAHYFPDAIVEAVDVSTDALAIAEQNINEYELPDKRIRLVNEYLFNGLLGQRYDIIVSNPPYVDEVEMIEMPVEFTHEPTLAFEGGFMGLDLVIQILHQASEYLTDKGVLIVEVGNSQIHLSEHFPDVPFVWLEFERGGHGVFLLTKQQLEAHKNDFNEWLEAAREPRKVEPS